MRTLSYVLRRHLLGTYKIGFSDAFIYRELEKPMNERELQQTFILHEEALKAFRAWEEKEDKIEY